MRLLLGTTVALWAACLGLGGQGATASSTTDMAAAARTAEHWRRVEQAMLDGTAEQRGLLEEGDILTMPPGNRNAEADPRELWPNREVVIELAPGEWPAEDKQALLAALMDIERESCVRFVKRTNQPNYLLLKHVGMSCASIVGFQEGAGGIPTFLGRGCMKKGTIQHEMMHVLGFWHEHTRPDRDEHLTVKWDHVEPGREFNFLKRPAGTVRTLGLPYDYGSVMHYRALAFSKDGLPTLVPRGTGPGVQSALRVMGQRERFSRLDIAKLNTLYNCPAPYYRRENVILDDGLVILLRVK